MRAQILAGSFENWTLHISPSNTIRCFVPQYYCDVKETHPVLNITNACMCLYFSTNTHTHNTHTQLTFFSHPAASQYVCNENLHKVKSIELRNGIASCRTILTSFMDNVLLCGCRVGKVAARSLLRRGRDKSFMCYIGRKQMVPTREVRGHLTSF